MGSVKYVAYVLVFCAIIGYSSAYLLGEDHPIEQLAEKIVSMAVCADPSGSKIDFSPEPEKAKDGEKAKDNKQ